MSEPSTGRELMPPPKPRGARKLPPKPKQLVLEEDEWAEQLEAIIERDFFPDVPKLQSKLEWLQVRAPLKRLLVASDTCNPVDRLPPRRSLPDMHATGSSCCNPANR